MSVQVAVATSSQIAADAAQQVAELGGNAVDCAIAAAMCSANTEPGVCALAGGAFVTIWAPGEKPVTIDGNVAVPGAGLPADHEINAECVTMQYGGGITTVIGPASVAVPGTLAALDLASRNYGSRPWRELIQPSIDIVREGFPLSSACHYYLEYSGDTVFGRSDEGHSALHDSSGALRPAHSRIVIAGLADSLEAIATEGSRIFYEGELGREISSHCQSNGGLLTMQDLRNYVPTLRESLQIESGDWTVASNPPPAIGGSSLAAMLLAFGDEMRGDWDERQLQRLVHVQEAVLSYRIQNLDTCIDVASPAAELVSLARDGGLLSRRPSGSTVHTSVVDDTGLACAITASSGYGSGEMPKGTGLWLNNALGELELNRDGLNAAPTGRRLPSNMAPSAARRKGRILAIGSPGADRITTALHQFLVNFLHRETRLEDAIAHPRIHLTVEEEGSKLAVECDLPIGVTGFPTTHYPEIGMYFGGVVAALYTNDDGFTVAADPRREGGTYVSPRSHIP